MTVVKMFLAVCLLNLAVYPWYTFMTDVSRGLCRYTATKHLWSIDYGSWISRRSSGLMIFLTKWDGFTQQDGRNRGKTANSLTIMVTRHFNTICLYFPLKFSFYCSLTSLLKIPVIFERWASPLLSTKSWGCACVSVLILELLVLEPPVFVEVPIYLCVCFSKPSDLPLYTLPEP